MAIIPGTDPVLKDQILVLGAHYDHIGKLNDSDDKEEDIIFNGADDNASGTAAVMAIAEAFAKSERQPARTVIFALFAAEEIGLLGSTSLLNQPPFATDSVVAMLNFDMVSRGGPDTLYLEGHSRTPELSDIILKYAPDLGIHPVTNNRESIGGSDHASFIRKGIPAIHFFSGIHKDYHQVSDNPDTIDPDKASRVSRLGFRTAWEIANSDRKFILLPPSSKP